MPYRFDVDGETWSSEDYTLGEQCDIERKLGLKLSYLNPAEEAIPRREFIVTWLARKEKPEDAAKRADHLTDRQVRVTVVEDDDRPIEWADGLPVVDPKEATAAPGTT
jgi:hypothetical protein